MHAKYAGLTYSEVLLDVRDLASPSAVFGCAVEAGCVTLFNRFISNTERASITRKSLSSTYVTT